MVFENLYACLSVAGAKLGRQLGEAGGEYSYLLVLPTNFFFKSVVIKINFTRISSDRHEI